MSGDVMLQEAIEAIRQGQRIRARDLLTRLLRADQSNPVYWLWMSSVVDSVKEQIYCLQQVQRLEPGNEAARRGLIMVGAIPADDQIKPMPPARRNWLAGIKEEPLAENKGIWGNPILRTVVIAGAGILVIGLILGGIFGFGNRRNQVALRPTKTAGPPPTFTLTPTMIGSLQRVQDTPTPTYIGPQPLWMLLEATYTPTPLYVNTPHPISEAYRLAERAFGRGDLATALRFFRDASRNEPNAPDIHYYIGEVQRLQGNHEEALAAYDQAIAIDSNFGPAYLGRVQIKQADSPGAVVETDLQEAVTRSPNYGEAYLASVAYYLREGDTESALSNLASVEELLPDSPMLYLYQAQIALQTGDERGAFNAASKAYELDRTLLPAYLILGQASLANDKYASAIEALEVYVVYAEDDAQGWLALGQAYAETGTPQSGYLIIETPRGAPDYEAALEAFDRVLELDEELAEAYIYRAITYLALEEGQKAVNDLILARRLEADTLTVNLLLGRGLIASDRVEDGFLTLDGSDRLAENDSELAAVYFVRAQMAEMHGRKSVAINDWEALLDLPEETLPRAWQAIAEKHYAALTAPTATPTPTITETSAVSPTPKVTLQPITTKKATSTPTPKPTTTP